MNAPFLGGAITIADKRISRLGLGTMRLTDPGTWNTPSDITSAITVLRDAMTLGITHIDTDDAYGPTPSKTSSAKPCTPTRQPPAGHQGRNDPPLPEHLETTRPAGLEDFLALLHSSEDGRPDDAVKLGAAYLPNQMIDNVIVGNWPPTSLVERLTPPS
ncbi:aldo/keto reductase [Streptosporangium sp. NPDC049248]|uniref:aldo/keto reductase n=1 Tax=Streptosporangium sp. NPDC049248 TaxID=3155651 RepID=UPI003437AF7A